MRELVILSGKGGTGKTSITAAFASLAESAVFCDADVDAADLHLLLTPDTRKISEFKAGHEAIIKADQCTGCGLCREVCRFDAVSGGETSRPEIDPVACEGCGVCVDLCPEKAIAFPETVCGQWYISDTRFGPMVHARLGIAQENSGKLVSLVRQEAAKLAEKKEIHLILTDGPPGVGCPVIAAISHATCVLIVAEPTVSGIHDMERAGQLTRHFNVPTMICINKYDLNPEQAEEIERLAERQHIAVVGKIPFDPAFTRAMTSGQTIFEFDNSSQAGQAVRQTWETIVSRPELNAPVTIFNPL